MQKRLNSEAAQAAMEAKGLTQTAIAKQLDVSKEAVSQWLKAKSFPRPNKLLQLGRLLELGFKSLVINEDDLAPVIAFRKAKGTRTKDHHLEDAQDKGHLLKQLVPFLPFDTLEVPPTLKAPTCEYEYLQRAAAKVRADIKIDPNTPLDFTHLIRRFRELQTVIIPVLWGVKKNHANAMHIHLRESGTTWVYLNLDVNIHDFKFWMAHELGHCLSPTLTGSEKGEDFADSFAGALLFPEEKAKQAYKSIMAKRTLESQWKILLEIADEEVISPYTVLLQSNEYAKNGGLEELDPGENYYWRICNFTNSYKKVSEALFENVEDISPEEYIEKASAAFETPFFDVLSQYLQNQNKGAGYVQAVTSMPLLDSRSLHAELT